MKTEEPDKEVVSDECKSAFDALSAAYKKSYADKKPILLKQIDKVLDDYLSFTRTKEDQKCGTTE